MQESPGLPLASSTLCNPGVLTGQASTGQLRRSARYRQPRTGSDPALLLPRPCPQRGSTR